MERTSIERRYSTALLPLVSSTLLAAAFCAPTSKLTPPPQITAEVLDSFKTGSPRDILYSLRKAEKASRGDMTSVIALIGEELRQNRLPSESRDIALRLLWTAAPDPFHQKSSLTVLNSIAGHDDAVIRGVAMFALTEHGERTPSDLVTTLTKITPDEFLQVTNLTHDRLSANFVPAYRALSESDNSSVRLVAISQLMRSGEKLSSDKLLADPDPLVRLHGVTLKAEQGDFEPAKQLLDSKNPNELSVAIQILSASGIKLSDSFRSVSPNEAKSIINSSVQPVIILFFNESCPPCRAFAPILNDFVQKNGRGMVFLRADSSGEWARQFTPTIFIFEDGKVVDAFSGATGIRTTETIVYQALGLITL